MSMTPTADRELCAELEQLTRWDEKRFYHTEYGVLYITQLPSSISGVEDVHCPAYTLGFLMRKLLEANVQPHLAYDDNVNQSWICWPFGDDGLYLQLADTPENAACKLVIQLIKDRKI